MKKMRYPSENEEEGKTKLENLIRNYPFHFKKVYNAYKEDREFPLYQIIKSCKMNGFTVPSLDFLYLQDMMRHGGLRPENISRVEGQIINHLSSLIDNIGYTEIKEYIEINNSFKELNTWIHEMHSKLSYYDSEGGWKKMGMDEIKYNKELVGGYLLKGKINEKFRKVFGYRNHFPREQEYENLMTSKEFNDILTDILQLLGKGSYKCNGGKIRLIGSSVEDVEERRVYMYIQQYPRVLKNMDDALEHKIKKKWNDIVLYCCKAIEFFFKSLLGNKKKYKKFPLSPLMKELRKKRKLFRCDDITWQGIDHILLSCENLVGTIRNSRDSGHGNDRDVLEWEAEMVYSYTITLFRTLSFVIK